MLGNNNIQERGSIFATKQREFRRTDSFMMWSQMKPSAVCPRSPLKGIVVPTLAASIWPIYCYNGSSAHWLNCHILELIVQECGYILATERWKFCCTGSRILSICEAVCYLPTTSSKTHRCSDAGCISMANILLLRHVKYHGIKNVLLQRFSHWLNCNSLRSIHLSISRILLITKSL